MEFSKGLKFFSPFHHAAAAQLFKLNVLVVIRCNRPVVSALVLPHEPEPFLERGHDPDP